MYSNHSAIRWTPDDEQTRCGQCNDVFTIMRRKHHCRVCGKLFCAECSTFKLLIPANKLIPSPSRQTKSDEPQRSCSDCARSLHDQQAQLRMSYSMANKVLLVSRDTNVRYMNLPFVSSMDQEIRKATYTLLNFTSDNILSGKDFIPRELLRSAKGVAFLTVAKVGFLLTGRIGTGLVVARLDDGSWSAPSGIAMTGMGWGFQAGGELTDLILILATTGAVEAFSSRGQVSLGTELSVALGPVGRSVGTDLHAGAGGTSAVYSYAHSKGFFLGISLEASAIAARTDLNRAFYGMDVSPSSLLNGTFPRPRAADSLYRALSEVLSCTSDGELSVGQTDIRCERTDSTHSIEDIHFNTQFRNESNINKNNKTNDDDNNTNDNCGGRYINNSIYNNFNFDNYQTPSNNEKEKIIDFSQNVEKIVKSVNYGEKFNSPEYANEATMQMYTDYYSPGNGSNTPRNKPNTDPLSGMILIENGDDHISQIRNKVSDVKLAKTDDLPANKNENDRDNNAAMDNAKTDEGETTDQNEEIESETEKEKENKMISSAQFEEIRF